MILTFIIECKHRHCYTALRVGGKACYVSLSVCLYFCSVVSVIPERKVLGGNVNGQVHMGRLNFRIVSLC